MKKTIAILAVLLVAALAIPSCQSDGGQIAERAAREATEVVMQTEKRIEDRIAISLAKLEAGEVGNDQVKAEAKTIAIEERDRAKAEVAQVWATAKADMQAEVNAWPGRAASGIGQAIGTFGQTGNIWLALGTLLGSVLYTKGQQGKTKLEIENERNKKYIVGGPYAQPGPQMQFQAPPPPAQSQWVHPNTGPRQGFPAPPEGPVSQ